MFVVVVVVTVARPAGTGEGAGAAEGAVDIVCGAGGRDSGRGVLETFFVRHARINCQISLFRGFLLNLRFGAEFKGWALVEFRFPLAKATICKPGSSLLKHVLIERVKNLLLVP